MLTNEQIQTLKAACVKAGGDEWQAKKISGDFYVIRKGSYRATNGYRTFQPIAEIEEKSTRDFIAAANPAVILSLLAERDADKARIAELEARTLTVNWPDDGMDDCYDLWGSEHCRDKFDCGYNFSAVRHEEVIREACAAAGITLVVGGE